MNEHYSPDMPTEPGSYLMRCMENDQDPERVEIWRSMGDTLMAEVYDLGCYDLESVHNGLTDITWFKIQTP